MIRRRPVRDKVRAFAAARHLNCKTAGEQARDAEKKIAISSRLSAKDGYQKKGPAGHRHRRLHLLAGGV